MVVDVCAVAALDGDLENKVLDASDNDTTVVVIGNVVVLNALLVEDDVILGGCCSIKAEGDTTLCLESGRGVSVGEIVGLLPARLEKELAGDVDVFDDEDGD